MGSDLAQFPIMEERISSYQLPNFCLAINKYLARPGRCARVCGVVYGDHHRPNLADLALPADEHSKSQHAREGPVLHLSLPAESGISTSCVQRAIYFIDDKDKRLVAFFRADEDFWEDLHLEVLAEDQWTCENFLSELRVSMKCHNIYRGKTVSIRSGPFGNLSLHIQDPPVTSRQDIILPSGLLEQIERQTLSFNDHATVLGLTGHHLKRGILLHGKPGTGKTLTAMYLASQMRDHTTILLTAEGLGQLDKCCAIARSLQPAIIVLEDIDLVAEERSKRNAPLPLLFTLLNEMDGFAADDRILFLLTTNRPEVLEPALASRPGRIDQAYEIPLPDEHCRQRLIELYACGRAIDPKTVEHLVKQTRGVSASFIRELMRRAVLLALNSKQNLNSTHCHDALDELLKSSPLNKRFLGFYCDEDTSNPRL